MILNIVFPNNLIVDAMLGYDNIPCLCKVGFGIFEIEFLDPLPVAVGSVHGWNGEDIDRRSPALAGGRYTHYCFGQIGLRKIHENEYQILNLKFFQCGLGWLGILSNSELCEEYQSEEPDWLKELEKTPKKTGKKGLLNDLP